LASAPPDTGALLEAAPWEPCADATTHAEPGAARGLARRVAGRVDGPIAQRVAPDSAPASAQDSAPDSPLASTPVSPPGLPQRECILLASDVRGAIHASMRTEPSLFRAEGAALDYLSAPGQAHSLGFCSVTELAEETLQMSVRSVRERLRLHRTLAVSAELCGAYLACEINASQVLVLAPLLGHESLTPWIELAKRTTVVELQKQVREARPEAEVEAVYKSLRIPVPLKVRLTFHDMFEFGRRVVGYEASKNELMEAFLAECGWAGQGIAAPDPAEAHDAQADTNVDGAVTADAPGAPPDPDLPRAGTIPIRISLEEAGRARQAIEDMRGFVEDFVILYSCPPANPSEAYDRLRNLRYMRNRLRAIQGRLLRALRRTRCYRLLGYNSIEAFIEEDIKLSPRLAREMISESYLFEDHPALELGFALGQIGISKAYRIKRLTTREEGDIDAWIDRASKNLYRTFSRECRFLELLRECDRRLALRFPGPFPHPGIGEAIEETLRCSFGWTAKRLNRELRRRGIPHNPGGSTDPARNLLLMDKLEVLLALLIDETYPGDSPLIEPIPFEPRNRQKSALEEPWIMLNLPLTDDTFADVTAMVLDFRRRFGRETARYVPILLAAMHFHETWAAKDPEAPQSDQAAIFHRDGYRCLMPGCRSRGPLHGHHIRFRSGGGTDHKWNRITTCATHHQRVIHAGYARVTGKAPHALRFEIGRRPDGRPIMIVEGGLIVEQT
jgi:hypothetical protein